MLFRSQQTAQLWPRVEGRLKRTARRGGQKKVIAASEKPTVIKRSSGSWESAGL